LPLVFSSILNPSDHHAGSAKVCFVPEVSAFRGWIRKATGTFPIIDKDLLQRRSERGQGGTMPRAPITGIAKSLRERWKFLNNVARTFFNAARLFPKDLRFEHEDAKLVSYPGCYPTTVRPWSAAI